MATRSVATVFGGSGFIGRHVVKRLAHKGFVVRVAVRDPEAGLFLKTAGAVGQVVPLFAALENEATVHRALDGASLAVNLVGILAEGRPGDFQRIHAEGAGRVARLAASAGVERLVQVSAIGADPASPSQYGSSKAAGEQAVRAAFPQATILRPSIVFGPDDHFFNRFAAMARLSPIMPVIAGDTRMQPVYVGDVADAVMTALGRPDAAGAVFELGGPRVWRFRELIAYVLKENAPAPADGGHPDGAGPAAGVPAGAGARQAADPRPVADAGAGQCGGSGHAGTAGPGDRADPGRTGGAVIPAPVPAGRRPAPDGAPGGGTHPGRPVLARVDDAQQ